MRAFIDIALAAEAKQGRARAAAAAGEGGGGGEGEELSLSLCTSCARARRAEFLSPPSLRAAQRARLIDQAQLTMAQGEARKGSVEKESFANEGGKIRILRSADRPFESHTGRELRAGVISLALWREGANKVRALGLSGSVVKAGEGRRQRFVRRCRCVRARRRRIQPGGLSPPRALPRPAHQP